VRNHSNKFYVYGHFDNAGHCFYIGKGIDNRAFSAYKRNVYWQRVARKGYKTSILYDNLPEADAFALEVELIARYLPKTNLTKGGYGGCTVNEKTKPIMAEKVRQKKKAWWATKSKEERRNLLKNCTYSKYWAKLTPEELSAEQKRRSSFRKLKKVLCTNNNIVYNSAREACQQLGIKYSSKVSAVCVGDRPHYRGFNFKYVSER
jgi:hypothetical protein